jgi:hypothetical protein
MLRLKYVKWHNNYNFEIGNIYNGTLYKPNPKWYLIDGVLCRKECFERIANNFKLTLITTKYLEMQFGFYLEDKFQVIGSIARDGEFSILNTKARRRNYLEWIENGHMISGSKCVWKDSIYYISPLEKDLVRFGEKDDYIYNFLSMSGHCDCHDYNIKRWQHNNKVILF